MNVIRLLMAQAACNADVNPRDFSFKLTVQLRSEWESQGLSAAKDCSLLDSKINKATD